MRTTVTVGMLYPGYSAEDDYPRLERMLGGDVRLPVVHTSMDEDAHRVDALLDLGGRDRLAEGARAVLEHQPDAVMWACTSGSFVFGVDGARAQAQAVQDIVGVPASSTSLAFVEALRHLGVRTVAVAATYPHDVARRFVEFLGVSGIEVSGMSTQGIVTAAEVGTFGHDEVLDLASSYDDPRAEAILVPDTALHTAEWVDSVEAHIGKPVLTANQVTTWQGLRLADRLDHHDGLGTLFRSTALDVRRGA